MTSVRRLWMVIVVLVGLACDGDHVTGPAPADATPDPAAAVFITSDIPNFWRAYDAGGRDGLSAPFQFEYIDKGTQGLQDFGHLRDLSALKIAQMVQRYPRYFADIRANTLSLASNVGVIDQIRAAYVKAKALYPKAVFPPVTFLFGIFSTGGTTSGSGMLVGVEFFSMGPSTPIDELGQFQRNNVHPLVDLPFVVSHEHVHIEQQRAGGLWHKSNQNLLEQALKEGSADFLGERASGGNINAHLMSFGLAHEAALWAEFKTAMHGADISRWLYNQGTATADRPGDLGYFIGYRMAQSYFVRMGGSVAAVQGIIEMTNADQFLSASGYDPR